MKMLVQMLQRLPWQLTCALFATVQVASAANIEASNSSMTEPISNAGQLLLQGPDEQNIAELRPLSMDATTRDIEGNLYLTTNSTFRNIADGDIAFISCDDNDYPGLIKVDQLFKDTYETQKINGAIFYSTSANFCAYTNVTAALQRFPIYSMNSSSDSQAVLDGLSRQSASTPFAVRVVRTGPTSDDQDGQQNPPNNNQPPQSPLGPSPSTAVAMIILYSITGIITALFLVIIITGAVRAHRHPDRYGPRDVLGRPRQSRARGLGRAILDTIPIVKFGQTETPKPTDVELGSTSETRDVNAANAATDTQDADAAADTRETPRTETPSDPTVEEDAGMESGISAAQPIAAGAAAAQSDSSDGGLGCSICTEDFENGQDIRVLPCNHKFHPDCVDPWLLNVSGTCPLCRVDLRPVTTNDTTDETDGTDQNHLAPPLQSDNDVSHRRRSVMRDILSFRTRPDASADERISALRRLREQRRNRSEEGVNASAEDVANHRRSKRLSVRLSGVFTGRRRGGNGREDSPPAAGESSTSVAPQPRDESPGPSTERTRPAENQDQR